jgi:hypothetical protein
LQVTVGLNITQFERQWLNAVAFLFVELFSKGLELLFLYGIYRGKNFEDFERNLEKFSRFIFTFETKCDTIG